MSDRHQYDPGRYDPDAAGGIEPPAAGSEVKCRILKEGTEYTESKSSGNPMLVVKMVVEEGQEGAGFHFWHYIVLNNEYVDQKIGALLDSCGLPTKTKQVITPMRLAGRICKVRVKHEEYKGESKAKIAWLIPKKKQGFKPEEGEAPPEEVPNTDQIQPTKDGDDSLPF